MGRPKRVADGGLVYHVLNRANARMTIFEKPEDYAAFERAEPGSGRNLIL
jgi:putative transposase